MPSILSVNDIIECRFGAYTASQAGINRVHFVVDAITNEPTDEQVAQGLDAAVHATYKAVMAPQASWYGVQVQRVFPLPRTVGGKGIANPGAGTDGTRAAPQQVSGIITTRTLFSGVKYRGRIYVPFPSEESNDPATNRPIVAYTTALQLLADDIFTPHTFTNGVDIVNIDPVVFHREDGSWHRIYGAEARDRWATQRRRSSSGRTNGSPPF